jgi:hypothetical protein
MTILDTVHAEFQHWAEYIKHGAAWLVGSATMLEKSVADFEASDPLVKEAADLAHSWAQAHGIPIADMEATANQILHLLNNVAGTPNPAPIAPAAPAANDLPMPEPPAAA